MQKEDRNLVDIHKKQFPEISQWLYDMPLSIQTVS